MTKEFVISVFVVTSLLFICVFCIVIRQIFYVVEVKGFSMAPFLINGDRVLVSKCHPNQIVKRGCIVILEPWTANENFDSPKIIKRVVGLPNDDLSIYRIRLGKLKGLVEDHTYRFFSSRFSSDTNVTYLTNSSVSVINNYFLNIEKEREVHVPVRHLFVKGDWLMGGDDSINRGPVPYNKVSGVVIYKLKQRDKNRKLTIRNIGS